MSLFDVNHITESNNVWLISYKYVNATKNIAEALLSDTYSIGLQLHSKDVFNSTKWKTCNDQTCNKTLCKTYIHSNNNSR